MVIAVGKIENSEFKPESSCIARCRRVSINSNYSQAFLLEDMVMDKKFKWNWENISGAHIPERSTFKNVENQRFGRLVALYPVKRHGGIHWFCNCDCGNNTLVKTSRLGATKSCGCLQKEYYNSRQKEFERRRKATQQEEKKRIGEKQGQLTIIDVYRTEKDSRIGYLCKCTCGNIKCIDKKYFNQYKPQTCNSKDDRRKSGNNHWKGYEGISSTYFSSIKISARNRGLLFDLKIEDLWEQFQQQNKRCAISGLCLDLEKDASIDRIDSDKGYTKKNIQWVHKHVNIMKNSQTMDQFLSICETITEYNTNK